MHISAMLFVPLSLLVGLVAARGTLKPTAIHCCSGGTADPTGICTGMKLHSFCCTNIDGAIGNGCDDISTFPTGRFIQAQVPGSSCNNTDGSAPGDFIGCA
ncbi:hypothetical protein LZ32DRAFT_31117 [Colletotrichum eremochloae]|nr:hypothetical protein LZ32DRAFT_31117 [Colletotrichum eremochloae]